MRRNKDPDVVITPVRLPEGGQSEGSGKWKKT
jgi:hypothetical protein